MFYRIYDGERHTIAKGILPWYDCSKQSDKSTASIKGCIGLNMISSIRINIYDNSWKTKQIFLLVRKTAQNV